MSRSPLGALMRPRVGEVRLYDDGQVPMLYPGERMHAVIGLRLRPGDPVRPRQWMVDPMPGWRGLYLRCRYRLIGRWLETIGIGRARLEVNVGRPQLDIDGRDADVAPRDGR